MQQRINSAILAIDLAAIAKNWLTFRAKAPNSIASAVVKADAYGLGMTRVVAALRDVGCDTYFVATLDEAIEFRDNFGSNDKVFVFSGCRSGEASIFIERNIIPVLNSLSQLQEWQTNASGSECAIMLDTGMNRLGLSAEELRQYHSNQTALLNIQYLLSHLACADNPGSPMNSQQLSEYQSLFDELRASNPSLKGSLSNSAGVLLGSAYHFDLIRPGIALYGGSPDPNLTIDQLQPVVGLSLPILQIRQLAESESVGYGADQIVPKGTFLATVQGGYADGIFRSAQGALSGLIKDIEVPLVGRVSMDYCVFDVTHVVEAGIPIAELQNNMYIELLNDKQTINDLARMENTVAYEVITALGNRYRKVYKG